jgi:Flp pilus assembly pilin Flp
MTKLMNRALTSLYLRKARAQEEGQTMAEYALILALIAVVAVIAITALGGDVSAAFQNIADEINV